MGIGTALLFVVAVGTSVWIVQRAAIEDNNIGKSSKADDELERQRAVALARRQSILAAHTCTERPLPTDVYVTGFEWTVSTKSNEDLINQLKELSFLNSTRVQQAMLAVDRADFVKSSPYIDTPQSIGYGATISAPHMHAFALELLKNHLFAGAHALDVGCGTGYLTTCMAVMVGPNGTATGVDHIGELVAKAKVSVKKHHADLLSNGRIAFETRDARMPMDFDRMFDVIHIGASVEQVPTHILDLLLPGGLLVAPVGKGADQLLAVVSKHCDGSVTVKRLFGVRYVPLTSVDSQLRDDSDL